jgi:hypothetical protein
MMTGMLETDSSTNSAKPALQCRLTGSQQQPARLVTTSQRYYCQQHDELTRENLQMTGRSGNFVLDEIVAAPHRPTTTSETSSTN